MSILSTIAKALAERTAKQGAERTVARRAAPLAVERKAAPLAVKSMAVKDGAWWDAPARRALPAPQRVLALPAPGPGLPAHAAKPRGGQWWVDKEVPTGDYSGNYSPEHAARAQLPTGVRFSSGPADVALRDWWDKALPRYLKNDFATADDPLRSLADRGLLPPNAAHPQIDADTWSRMAGESFGEDSIGSIMFPSNPLGGMPGAGDELRAGALTNMPWLAKQPVTDNLYQMRPRDIEDLNFSHVGDELRNALNPEVHGFPSDLAVRPESLGRMSFPQAVEHVGKIGQWREAQMAKQQAEAMNNPAIQIFKEYPDDPRGMRWVEIKQPTYNSTPHGYSVLSTPDGLYPTDAAGYSISGPGGFKAADADEAERRLREHAAKANLQDALKHEGDTMGHCVGGYCDDVASGRSRIFSLRDSKGQPHVTVETEPGRMPNDAERIEGAYPEAYDEWMAATERGNRPSISEWFRQTYPDRFAELPDPQSPDSIVQIKGKQNRAPNDDYLPYVQDFVKSQQWGKVGDLRNSNLVQLPDGRYVDNTAVQERLEQRAKDMGYHDPAHWDRERTRYHSGLDPERWDQYSKWFEGFAYGGRVDAHRDFARHPMAVRRAA